MSILIAILTSLVASVVFYIFFDFIPNRIKYKRIRPRVEVEITEICDQLFFYLDSAMHHEEHVPSFFQSEIQEGAMTEDDFEIGLYNKCLNRSYCLDDQASKMIFIGATLEIYAKRISSKIQQVLMNQAFLSPEEILIVEDIDRLLYTYLYNNNAVEKIGTVTVVPINPTISYMRHNFYQLYELYIQLSKEMFRYKHIADETRQGKMRYLNLNRRQILYLLNKQKYKEAKKALRKLLNKHKEKNQDEITINALLLRYYVETGNKTNASELLRKFLNNPKRDKLVYERGRLQCIRSDPELMSIVMANCQEDEIDYWNKVVSSEENQKNSFISQNKELKRFYEEKRKSNSTIL